VVTSDNPRSEDPEQIIVEIMAGIDLGARSGRLAPRGPDELRGPDESRGADEPRVRSITDRRAAIAHAIGSAGKGDVVVIAGKGHEQGQELAEGRKTPFDDAAVAREALRAREERSAVGGSAGAGGPADRQAGARA
jgi:UDP-N-acetylmuramoyl-L-alanyl-D-glutamate--2,6-diaminopimelate ligase